MTIDLGKSWAEWTWEQPELGLDGLVVALGPFFYSEAGQIADAEFIGSHSGHVGDRKSMYVGEPHELVTFLAPPHSVIVDEFGEFDRAWQSSDAYFTVEGDGGSDGFTYAVSAVGRDITVDFINRDDDVFHTATVEVPAGFDVEDLVVGMQEQWLMIPGMWWSEDGRLFEWEPVTDLTPFETPHFEYVAGAEVTIAFGVQPSGQGHWEIWRLDTDGHWEPLAAPFVNSDATVFAQGSGLLAALSQGGVLRISYDYGDTYKAGARFPPGPVPPQLEGASYDQVFVTQHHILVASSGSPYMWAAPHNVSEWTLVSLPAAPATTAEIYVAESGAIYYQDEHARWRIGNAR